MIQKASGSKLSKTQISPAKVKTSLGVIGSGGFTNSALLTLDVLKG